MKIEIIHGKPVVRRGKRYFAVQFYDQRADRIARTVSPSTASWHQQTRNESTTPQSRFSVLARPRHNALRVFPRRIARRVRCGNGFLVSKVY